MSPTKEIGKSLKSDFSFTAILILTVAIFINLGMPDDWEKALIYGQIHLYYSLALPLYLIVFGVAYLRNVFSGKRIYLWIALLTLLYMTGLGILQRSQVIFEWRILIYDVFVFVAFICGILLVLTYSPQIVLPFIRITCTLWLLCLLLDSTLLQLGLIQPAWPDSQRIHVWAEFICTNGMMYSFPFLLHPSLNVGALWTRGKTLVAVSILVILYVNIAMGARGLLIALLSTVVLSLPLQSRRFSRLKLYGGSVVFGLACLLALQIPSIASSNLAIQRLQQTDVNDEDRVAELSALFDYMGGYTIFGLGNGTGFPSPTTRPDEDFAAYPHISILTPLQKGGIPGFVALIIYPGAILVVTLFRRRSTFLQQCGATSALLVLIFSTISGNWTIASWLYYGIGLGYCFYGKKSFKPRDSAPDMPESYEDGLRPLATISNSS